MQSIRLRLETRRAASLQKYPAPNPKSPNQNNHPTERALHDPLIRAGVPSVRWVNTTLRKCTGQKDSTVLPAGAPWADQENNILTALHAAFNAVEIVQAVDRLLIDLQDHVATIQSDVLGKGTGLHVLHDDALAGGHVEPVCDFRRQGPHCQAELARLGFFLVVTLLILAEASSEEFLAVGDGYCCFFFFAVADKAQLGFAPGLAAGDVGNQIVA